MLENYTCSLCSSNSPTSACICDSDINLMCSSCKQVHSLNSSSGHQPLQIHLAIRLQSDSNLYEEYIESTQKASVVISRLQIINTRVKRYKSQLQNDKLNLICQIESLFNKALDNYDDSEHELKHKMRIMTDYKQNLCEEGRELINKFYTQGDEKLTAVSVEEIKIPVEEIVEFTKDKLEKGHHSYKMTRRDQEENPDESQELSYYKLYTEDLEIKIKKLSKNHMNTQLELAKKDSKLDNLRQSLKMYKECMKDLKHELRSIRSYILNTHSENILQDLPNPSVPDSQNNNIQLISSYPAPEIPHDFSTFNSQFIDLTSSDDSHRSQFIYTLSPTFNGIIQHDISSHTLSYLPTSLIRKGLNFVNICKSQMNSSSLQVTLTTQAQKVTYSSYLLHHAFKSKAYHDLGIQLRPVIITGLCMFSVE